MDLWTALLDILILLLAAMVLGGLCERLKQSAILGYLVAGTLLGPNALNWIPDYELVTAIAELGVALLLFTIGLEFSYRRLRSLGLPALGGGTLQVVLTGAVTTGICVLLGLSLRPSLAVGAMIALSSTACVLRLLLSRAELDNVHGRNAVGILLLQDIAVVPLVLGIAVLGKGGDASEVGANIAEALAGAAIFAAAAYVLLNRLAPLLFSVQEAARNRELPILLAIITAMGAAWAAHRIGFSPAIGPFFAGILLASSPFATQIRADVVPLRTLFVTLFFSSIGMVADPAWVTVHWIEVVLVVVAIVLGKALITCGVLAFLRVSLGYALAAGVCLAQVGEFSFVIAAVAQEVGLIDDHLFSLMVSATIVTLFLTPYLVAVAPRLAVSIIGKPTGSPVRTKGDEDSTSRLSDHVVIVGFGPAGQRVAESLIKKHKSKVVIVELNPKTAAVARSYDLQTHIGDATKAEVLEHVNIAAAKIVAITLPAPAASRLVIEQVRSLAPEATIIVRARYHVHRWQLTLAGAQVVVDEEDRVGMHIAAEVRRRMLPEVIRKTANDDS